MPVRGVVFDTCRLEQALVRAKAENKLVLVRVTASWCAPCQEMEKEVLDVKEVGDYCHQHFVCVEWDAGCAKGKSLAKEYAVHKIPTFLLLDAGGNVQHRLLGKRSRELFMDWLERGKHFRTSLACLERRAGQGKIQRTGEWVDYYAALRAAKDFQKADSVREMLLSRLQPKEISRLKCWPLFREETEGSACFSYVGQHAALFMKGIGEKRLDDFLGLNEQEKVQGMLYRQDFSPEMVKKADSLSHLIALQMAEQRKGNKKAKLEQQENALAWARTVKACLGSDTGLLTESLKQLAIRKQWKDCLWHAYIMVGKNAETAQKEELSKVLPGILFQNSKNKAEEWEFYQKLRYLGFPVSCNHVFWENAVRQAAEKQQPLLVECVRGADAYYMDRKWIWDVPELEAYTDSVCVVVRLDLEAPDMAKFRDYFDCKNYPAYFLRQPDGLLLRLSDGKIQEEEDFKQLLNDKLKE